ncbi:uracil-DNA glycosylase-like protein [Phycomyces nitens]|nr:uracil-DNA glycosylase-like protein [Phycomyces nitens]
MDNKKRSLPSSDTSTDAKRHSSGSKKQVTLMSMFKMGTPTTPKPIEKTQPIAESNQNESKGDLDQEKSEIKDLVISESNGNESKNNLGNDDKELNAILDLEITYLENGWFKALKPELTKQSFLNLKLFLRNEKLAKKTIYPADDQIYSWSKFTPLSKVKVVILGQDPYHNVNQAHGLCFSVLKGVPPPPSLVNIYKAIAIDYPDFKKPNHGYLEEWAKQGILMLNTSLTVRAHEPASHSNKGWEQFTEAIINHLNEKKKGIVFLLWGAHAQKKGSRIDTKKHLVLKATHPSPLSAHRGFFECHHFKLTNEYLSKNGKAPINWNCLADS